MTQKEMRLKKKPRFTRGLLKSIKVKNNMLKIRHTGVLRNNPRDLIVEVEQRFKNYRNALNRLISVAKREYCNKIFIVNKSNPRTI